MRTKQLFLILALLCTMVQGAWAQASWDEVYTMTNTTSANWTALPEGTTAGATISPSTTPLPATASGAAKHKEIPRGSRRMAATSAVSSRGHSAARSTGGRGFLLRQASLRAERDSRCRYKEETNGNKTF